MGRERKARAKKAYDPRKRIIALGVDPDLSSGDCCGPFERGQAGTDAYGGCFAECCDNLCPPDGCCTCVEVYFECGSDYDPIEFTDGCVRPHGCDPPAMMGVPSLASFKLSEIKADDPDMPDMPVFTTYAIQSEDGNFVFALMNGCSIPCSEVKVTLTAGTGVCCFDIDGDDLIYAVGAGTVSATIDPTTYDDCGALTPYINGSPSTTTVADGEEITITVEPTEGDCCQCCQTRVENPCQTAPLWIASQGKIIMNNAAVQRRITRLKRRALKLRNKK